MGFVFIINSDRAVCIVKAVKCANINVDVNNVPPVREVLFVPMAKDGMSAKIVKEEEFAKNMAKLELAALNVMVRKYANINESDIDV